MFFLFFANFLFFVSFLLSPHLPLFPPLFYHFLNLVLVFVNFLILYFIFVNVTFYFSYFRQLFLFIFVRFSRFFFLKTLGVGRLVFSRSFKYSCSRFGLETGGRWVQLIYVIRVGLGWVEFLCGLGFIGVFFCTLGWVSVGFSPVNRPTRYV